ncbi:MAG: alpha-L-fucosidase [Chloracidobacterium sp.]|nr:alpha-L-fucosidase [Chloracidobacterium sp.]
MKTFLLTFIFALLSVRFALATKVSPPRPVAPVPSPEQLAWQRLEYYAFAHFGMNTFTDHEWGEGRASADNFNPTALDCRQWARIVKAAGMNGIIITAKHHDGFCLWPSKTTEYSVKNSKWREGRGDVLKELSEACKEYGLKFGVYLSPWDRNHPLYGAPKYNRVFKDQWREIGEQYGEIFESWLDGANDGKKRMVYDFHGFFETIKSLQPNTLIFSDAGPDIRWVGNERGFAGETNWSPRDNEGTFPGFADDKALNVGDENGTVWLPAECDVSIRPGWFYHSSEDDKLKSVEQLMNIYYGSVGRNANLLLNIGIDRRGLVNENDERRLMEFKRAREEAFKDNLAGKSNLGKIKIKATSVRGNDARFDAEKTIDGNASTYWAADDGVTSASLELDFGREVEFNTFLAQENIALGQRVKMFSLEIWGEGGWETVSRQTTIGYKRILRFPTVKTARLKFNIEAARACPTITNVEIYNSR